jgi:hypothetical protein
MGWVAFIAAAFVALFGIAYGLSAVSCGARWPDRPTDFGLFSGCLVKVNDGWAAEDRVWFERNQ